MAGGRAFKSNVRERREAERRMKALSARRKKRAAEKAATVPALDPSTRRPTSGRDIGRRTKWLRGVCKASIHQFESGRRLSLQSLTRRTGAHSASSFAARTKSFSESPPTACVQIVTSTTL